ncbi:MAG TPA: hypothetical protein PK358_12845 [Spirochaetota bacterium]|nr:hypothetical protein [Spirochaetota bacterium]HPJ35717.1 hypothetical protein [Spirochaetota bacterium]
MQINEKNLNNITLIGKKFQSLIRSLDAQPNLLLITTDVISIKHDGEATSEKAMVGDFIINGDVAVIRKGIDEAVAHDDIEYFYDRYHSYMSKRRNFSLLFRECDISSWNEGYDLLNSMLNRETLERLGLEYILFFDISDPGRDSFIEFAL